MDQKELDELYVLLNDIDKHEVGINKLTIQDKIYIMDLQEIICDVQFKINRLKGLKPKLIKLKNELEENKNKNDNY